MARNDADALLNFTFKSKIYLPAAKIAAPANAQAT